MAKSDSRRWLDRGTEWAERGWVPTPLLRAAIAHLVRERAVELERQGGFIQEQFLKSLRNAPIALAPGKPNQQHYEVDAAFFEQVLGRHRKYSCGLFENPSSSLDQAEAAMLALSCERAGLEDGQQVLELGCGWGSLTLWMAERYPNSRILSVSNSEAQCETIRSSAAAHGLRNIELRRCDMNDLELRQRFDRVVSIEMFEHMRNLPLLFERLAGWLERDGRAFLHVFSHRSYAYPYETEGSGNWMARNFFTGGMMPSHDLYRVFDEHLVVESSWRLSGEHYARTAEAWLARLDAARAEIEALALPALGSEQARRFVGRWRMFFLAVSGCFGFRGGSVWGVSHHLLRPRGL